MKIEIVTIKKVNKMNRFFLNWQLMALGVLLLVTVSCNDDDGIGIEKPIGLKGKYLITTTVKNPDGMSGSSFIKLIVDSPGVTDNSGSIQVNFGVGAAVRGNDIFTFPSFGKDGNPNLSKYTYTGTTDLGNPTELNLPANSGASNITVISENKVYLPAYNAGKVYIFNPKTMKKTGEIELSEYAHGDNSPEPANGILRDGLYYLTLDQVGSDYMPYPEYRQADVLIIDPTTDKVTKMISEAQSNLSFPTRPMELTKGMIFMNEQKDIYIACVGSFGFDKTYLNSGFVCIPAGEQEFDVSKTWDISNTSIEGTNYKPASIYNTHYIGNGKVVAYVGVLELLDPKNPYTSRNTIAVLMDLNTKTIKRIEGVPVTDGHSVCLDEYKDLVVLGAYGKNKAGFFTYNPTTEEVEYVLSTVGNPASFHYFE